MGFDWTNLGAIALRSSIVYVVIILGFRAAGKRHLSQLSLIDFALILLVSNAVQNAMVGPDTSLIGGIAAAGALMVVNVILTKLLVTRQNVAHFLEGEPRLLVRNGEPVLSNLACEDIRLEELEEQIREHGFEDMREVRTAILEIDGTISVIPYSKDGTHIEHHLPVLRSRKLNRRGTRK